MGYLYLSWISVKMSPCQPCQLVFVTSICCFCECLHRYLQGPSTQGTFTPSGSCQALPRHCLLPYSPRSSSPQSLSPRGVPASCPQNSGSHTPQPQRQKEILSSPEIHFPFCIASKWQWEHPFFLENFSSHTWGGAPKALRPQGPLLGPL